MRAAAWGGRLALALLCCAGAAPAAAAGCTAGTSAVEQALCAQPDLARAEAAVRAADTHLRKECADTLARAPWPLHTDFMAKLQATFDPRLGIPAAQWVDAALSQRSDALEATADACAQATPRITFSLQTLQPDPARRDLALPFARSVPAIVGLRANQAIYQALLQTAPPESAAPAKVTAWWNTLKASGAPGEEPLESGGFRVLLRTPRALLLGLDRTACSRHCDSADLQLLLDLRTGRAVAPDALFTPGGRTAFAREAGAALTRAVRSAARRQVPGNDQREQQAYSECLQQWSWRGYELAGLRWQGPNHWKLPGPTCDPSGQLPALEVRWPASALHAHWSAYGRALMANTDTPQEPAPHAESVCPAAPSIADPAGWARRVAQISSGEDHAFLREPSDRVWGWGRNYNGAVGNGTPGGGGGNWVAPFVMGDDYLQAGAGQGYSAVIRKDGTLWTWGNNYAARLGDGSRIDQPQPVRIASGMRQLLVGNGLSFALAEDARLWAWGGEQIPNVRPDGREGYRLVPRVIASRVAQVREGGAGALILQDDGQLWQWAGWWRLVPEQGSVLDPEALAWRGAGFHALPTARRLELAFRADGSAWAWGETLQALGGPTAPWPGLPAREDNPWPRLVGQGWVDVKAAHRGTVLAVRKADGSLLVTQRRGLTIALEPLGCGFTDMAFAYDERGTHMLGLRADGTLLDWTAPVNRETGKLPEGWDVHADLLGLPPVALLTDAVRLFQENDYHGNVGAHVFALRRDGRLAQWYWRFSGRYGEQARQPQRWFEEVALPPAWFARPGGR